MENIPDFVNDKPKRQFSQVVAKTLFPDEMGDIRRKYKLNIRQFKFIAIYCHLGFQHQQKAYEWAGYDITSKTAARNGAQRILSIPSMQKIMDEYLRLVMGPLIIQTRYKLVNEFMNRAFYDPATFIDPKTMKGKKLADIPKEWRRCIDGVEEKYQGKESVRTIKYSLANRDKALDVLARFAQFITTDDLNISVSDETKTRIQNIFGQRGESNSPALKLLKDQDL